jgi:hypothetical protein
MIAAAEEAKRALPGLRLAHLALSPPLSVRDDAHGEEAEVDVVTPFTVGDEMAEVAELRAANTTA